MGVKAHKKYPLKDWAYILGVYLGDGCVTRHKNQKVFRLNTIDSDFAEATKNSLINLKPHSVNICKHSVKKSTNPNHALRCAAPDLCARLVDDTQGKQVIPAYVWEMPIDAKREFIAGVMDSEGFVAAKTSYANNRKTGRGYYLGIKCCDKWINDFAKILQSIGVEVGKMSDEAPLHKGYKTPTRFHVKIQSWVDAGCYFKIRRKQVRIDEWAATEPYTQRALYPRGGPQRICTVEGCDKKYLAKGYCNLHYYRFIKSPITGRKEA